MYLDMLTLYLRKDKAKYKPVIIFPHRLHSYVKFMYSAPQGAVVGWTFTISYQPD